MEDYFKCSRVVFEMIRGVWGALLVVIGRVVLGLVVLPLVGEGAMLIYYKKRIGCGCQINVWLCFLRFRI